MNEEYVDVEVDGENDNHNNMMNDDMNDNNNNDNNDDFCNGMSMIMSMSGFQSALFGTKKSAADCLTFLFTKWTLETPGKFQGAMGEYLAGFFLFSCCCCLFHKHIP
jgi:hypothetical protein